MTDDKVIHRVMHAVSALTDVFKQHTLSTLAPPVLNTIAS